MFVRLYFVKDYLRCSSRKQECYLHLKLVIEYLDIVVRCIEYDEGIYLCIIRIFNYMCALLLLFKSFLIY